MSEKLENQNSSIDDYENQMLEAFINKPEKTSWYQKSFEKYTVNGIDKMSWNWSWWAFFGGVFFLLYRKAYLEALVLFIASITLGLIPFVGLIIAILAGGFSTYFIYKKFDKKKIEIESSIEDTQKRIDTMRAIGGYNNWVIWVYSIFMILVFIGIMAAASIPEV